MRRTLRRSVPAILAALALATPAMAQPRGVVAPAPARPGPPRAPVIYTMEQIAVADTSQDLRDALLPAQTMQQAEEILKIRGLTFVWRRVEVNSATLDPDFARQLAALPPHEVLLAPQGKGIVLGVIVQQRPASTASPDALPPPTLPMIPPQKMPPPVLRR